MNWLENTLEFSGEHYPGQAIFELCWPGGHIVPPFENHVPLILTANYLVVLQASPKLDLMTHLGFQGMKSWVKCHIVSDLVDTWKIIRPNIVISPKLTG